LGRRSAPRGARGRRLLAARVRGARVGRHRRRRGRPRLAEVGRARDARRGAGARRRPRGAREAAPAGAAVIVTNAVLVTHAEPGVLEPGAVRLEGDRVTEVGPSPELEARHPDEETLDAHGCLVTPGLVNAHM